MFGKNLRGKPVRDIDWKTSNVHNRASRDDGAINHEREEKRIIAFFS